MNQEANIETEEIEWVKKIVFGFSDVKRWDAVECLLKSRGTDLIADLKEKGITPATPVTAKIIEEVKSATLRQAGIQDLIWSGP